jgi:hypothetical protein
MQGFAQFREQIRLRRCRVLAPLNDRKQSFGSHDFDSFGAALRIYLPHDAPQMILYGKFRQIQTGGYLLVG